MGNKTASRKLSARRAAVFLAALGALVMSSGVALIATATPANAVAQKVVVCKYVSTPGGHVDHVVVVDDNTLPDEFDGNFPFSWTDAHGQSSQGSVAIRYANPGPPPEQAKDISLSECPQSEEPQDQITTASVSFTDPTCDNGNAASYATSGEHVTFDAPTAAPDASITVTATTDEGFIFDGGDTTATFSHTFTAAEDCGSDPETPPTTVDVDPPTTTTTKHHTTTKSTTTVSTPTVVHAGLTSVSSSDLRGEQGLALVFAGMLMLLGAGGLGLRLRGVASRI